MEFKNTRKCHIHLPNSAIIQPGATFELSADDVKNAGIVVLMRARWITPEDDEAKAAVTADANAQEAKTAQRMKAVQNSKAFSPQQKAAAQKNQAKLDAAAKTVSQRPTPLEKEAKVKAIALMNQAELVAAAAVETDPDVRAAIGSRAEELLKAEQNSQEALQRLQAAQTAAATAVTTAAPASVPAETAK